MPRFEPFAGVRYDTDQFSMADVTAPPYDVLSAADRAALCARSDHNVVCIDVPSDAGGVDRYTEAGARFDRWRAEGALITDPEPTFTLYRMSHTDDSGRPATTVGVIGALELSRPDDGEILPHEHTTPKARSDRLDLLRATRANLSPVWGLSLATDLSHLLTCDGPPLEQWNDDDGVDHAVWKIRAADQLADISAAVGGAPMVIADGHHRYETCLAYRDERRASEGTGGPADATMCFVVELAPDQLTVRPIHRLLTGLPEGMDLRQRLADSGLHPGTDIEATAMTDGRWSQIMADEGALVLVEPGRATLLHPDPAAFGDLADLDSARLARALEALPAHTVSYQHGAELVVEAVGNGEAQAGILVRPPEVAQIERNAHARRRMPAKTTFFHPKPKTGIVFRDLS